MTRTSGTRIGTYKISAAIGAGGMGERIAPGMRSSGVMWR